MKHVPIKVGDCCREAGQLVFLIAILAGLGTLGWWLLVQGAGVLLNGFPLAN